MRKGFKTVLNFLVFLGIRNSSWPTSSSPQPWKRSGVLATSKLLIMLVAAGMSACAIPEKPLGVHLKSRTLVVPGNRIEALRPMAEIPAGRTRHLILQMDEVPSAAERRALEAAGIRLLQYVQHRGWLASVRGPVDKDDPLLARVRGSWLIEANDRFSPRLRIGKLPKHAIEPDGRVKLTVLAFEDADIAALVAQIKALGGSIDSTHAPTNILYIRIPSSAIKDLANLDALHWMQPVAPGPAPELYRARAYVNNDAVVGSEPGELNGKGVQVSIHEGGHADRHSDFVSRWVQGDEGLDTFDPNDHTTMTAGNIAGDGDLDGSGNRRGMAPEAGILTYSFGRYCADFSEANLFGDIADALQRKGVSIANNSWGWSGCNDPDFPYGEYTLQARLFDYHVLNPWGGSPAVIVFSAGNERYGYEDCNKVIHQDCISDKEPPYVNYATINQPKPAKNIIVVGAVDSDNGNMSAFSSWGPVSDGRLRPDIVAGGLHNGHAYIAPRVGNVYGNWGGTSAAAATVSGNAALFIEGFRDMNFGSNPLPSTVKAHFIHTAKDLDDDTAWYNPGPDYASGYGVLDIEAAVAQLRSGAWQEACINHGESNAVELYVPADTSAVKFTLVWDDPPASPMSAGALINDLDLVVTDSLGVRRFPWVLDASRPSNPASRNNGPDDKNNVEMVFVDGTVPVGLWTIEVVGTGVQESPQCYSLVYSPITTGWTDATSEILAGTGNSVGVAWGDYYLNDGYLDLYLSNYEAPNKLFFNITDGRFGNATGIPGNPVADSSAGQGIAWADYDNDGDLDLYLSNYLAANKLFQNNGSGDFTDVTGGPLADAGTGHGINWVDYDNDGHLDLYLVKSGSNTLLRNLGNSNFADVTSISRLGDAAGGWNAAWADYDNDGDQDVYIANRNGANKLYRNQGNGKFTDVTDASGPIGIDGYKGSAAWGDYDNDGDMDLYVTEWSGGNKLFNNNGDGTFADVTTASGLAGPQSAWGAGWVDYDNDGDLDLYVANGRGTAIQASALFRNDGTGAFTNVTNLSGSLGFVRGGQGIAWGDYDNDGDVDLYVASNSSDATSKLFRNEHGGRYHWLHIDLVGTCSNRSAIGARVMIEAGGMKQIREVSGGGGYFSQDSLTVEFGLGSATVVDVLEIRWPSGIVQILESVATDQKHVIGEPVCLEADLAVDKSDTPDPVIRGEEKLKYLMTVTNNGPDWATGVRLIDNLPWGVNLVDLTATQGSCISDLPHRSTFRCNLRALSPGDTATIKFLVTVNTSRTLNNSARVSGVQSDPDSLNNIATSSTTVIEGIDLQLTKVDSQDPVTLGNDIEYTLRVTNNGPRPATSVVVRDTLPGVDLVSITPDQGSCRSDALPQLSVNCNVGPVDPGQTVTIVIRVTPLGAGNITNTASVTANVPDPNPADNTASESTAVVNP